MTSDQLQRSWIEAQQRLEAHTARRDARHHARAKAEPTLGDRVAADKRTPRQGGAK